MSDGFQDVIAPSNSKYLQLTSRLQIIETRLMRHSELEKNLGVEGRDLIRTLLEDHIRFRGLGDLGPSVIGSDNVERKYKQIRSRLLVTVFGKIEIKRLSYSCPGEEGLCPLDAALNLPRTVFSFGLQKIIAYEIARGSFEDALDATLRQTGVKIARRQAEDIVLDSAQDFDAFYAQQKISKTRKKSTSNQPLVIITTDGKGIVVRKEDLREQTKLKAEKENKLKKRLTKGEKLNRKRMATVASVYQIDRYIRSVDSIVGELRSDKSELAKTSEDRPRPQNKRVWASIEKSQKDVIGEMFDEALKRDPELGKEWVCLIDGCRRQLRQIRIHAKGLNINVGIVLDIIHVIDRGLRKIGPVPMNHV